MIRFTLIEITNWTGLHYFGIVIVLWVFIIVCALREILSAVIVNRLFSMDLLCRLLLALVFFYSGIPKLFAIKEFAGVVDAYGILPEFLVLPSALIIAVLEVVAAVGLVLGKNFAIHLTLLLMCLFIAVLSYGVWLGLDIDCGCFVAADPEYKAFSGLKSALFRDFILLLPLMYLYYKSSLGILLKKRKG